MYRRCQPAARSHSVVRTQSSVRTCYVFSCFASPLPALTRTLATTSRYSMFGHPTYRWSTTPDPPRNVHPATQLRDKVRRRMRPKRASLGDVVAAEVGASVGGARVTCCCGGQQGARLRGGSALAPRRGARVAGAPPRAAPARGMTGGARPPRRPSAPNGLRVRPLAPASSCRCHAPSQIFLRYFCMHLSTMSRCDIVVVDINVHFPFRGGRTSSTWYEWDEAVPLDGKYRYEHKCSYRGSRVL